MNRFIGIACVVLGFAAYLAACGTGDCPPGAHYDSVYCHRPDSGTDALRVDGALDATHEAATDVVADMGIDARDVAMDADSGMCGPPGSACGAGLTCAASGTCTCGNHHVDPGEDCDNGTNAPGSGCEPTCLFTCSATRTCPMTPPDMICMGPTSCDPTTHACVRVMPVPAGTMCGASLFCDGMGGCHPCTPGSACVPPGTTCRVGTTVCSSGSATCMDSGPAPVGTTCTATGGVAGVCDATSHCNPCSPGAACGSDPCSPGTISCGTGMPVCTPGAHLPPGTACSTAGVPTGVCNTTGMCVPCTAGMSCSPAACHTGSIVCSSGAPVCMDTGIVAPGTSCGTMLHCDPTGACSCHDGVACTPAPCQTGMTDCTSGTSVCRMTGTVADGTSCGTSMVCHTGSCVPCTMGMGCTSSNMCHTAAINCASGVPVCTDNGNVPNGTACAGGVCGGGVCNVCVPGTPCSPSNPCHTAAIQCGTGFPVCTDTGNVPNGTACSGGVCGGGVCNGCVPGTPCSSANPCHTAAIQCTTGFPVCGDTGNRPNGTSCGTNLVCNGGICSPCTAGLGCTPANPCHTGTTSCASGTQQCVDSGISVTDTTACGTGYCYGGVCQFGCGHSPGQPCCTGSSCPGTRFCESRAFPDQNHCVDCGGVGQHCCSSGSACFGGTCSGGVCNAIPCNNQGDCGAGATCQGAGPNPGDPCASPGNCRCEECGTYGNLCCPNAPTGTCGGGLSCVLFAAGAYGCI